MTMLPPNSIVLVTGATGFTGRALTRRLIDEGHTVRAIVRESSDVHDLSTLPITWFKGDVYDPILIREAVRGVHYIIHMATLYRDARADAGDHAKVHVDSTRYLAAAAATESDFRRFVHISTVGVHGHIQDPPADEEAPFNPGDDYQRTKLEAERWLRCYAPKHGLPYTVLRPAAIYGPEDRRLLKLFRMALRPYFPLLGHGKCLYHLIHVDDLVDLILRAAVYPQAQGQVYICGNPEAISLEHLGRTIAGALGHELRFIRLPAWPIFILADLCEKGCRPFGLNPPLYRRRVAFFTKDRCFDTRKVCKHLEWTPKFSNEEGLRLTATAYRAAGLL